MSLGTTIPIIRNPVTYNFKDYWFFKDISKYNKEQSCIEHILKIVLC